MPKSISESKDSRGEVSIYDLDGELIACFKSIFQAGLLMNKPPDFFYNKGNKSTRKTKDGLIIKLEK